jgi:hypothetical protein
MPGPPDAPQPLVEVTAGADLEVASPVAERPQGPPLPGLRVRRYPDFVEVVIGPLSDDDGTAATDPSNPQKIGLFQRATQVVCPLRVCTRGRTIPPTFLIIGEGGNFLLFSA